jgi:hypothetical protein
MVNSPPQQVVVGRIQLRRADFAFEHMFLTTRKHGRVML